MSGYRRLETSTERRLGMTLTVSDPPPFEYHQKEIGDMNEQSHPATSDRKPARLDWPEPPFQPSTPGMGPHQETAKSLHVRYAKLEMRRGLRGQRRLSRCHRLLGWLPQSASLAPREPVEKRSAQDASALAPSARHYAPCAVLAWLSEKRWFRRDDRTPIRAIPPAQEREGRRGAGLLHPAIACLADLLRRHSLLGRNRGCSCAKGLKNGRIDQA